MFRNALVTMRKLDSNTVEAEYIGREMSRGAHRWLVSGKHSVTLRVSKWVKDTFAGSFRFMLEGSVMSELSTKLLSSTSKPASRHPALLVLEDGTTLRGTSCGAAGEVLGEVCFNTCVEGYLEVITDPSYAGQIVIMTYPQIGNYGVNLGDAQASSPALRGLIVNDMCYTPSSWRSDMSLPDFLQREGVVAVEGIDTRSLVKHVRERGALRAVLSTDDLNVESLTAKARASEPIVGTNLVETVSCGAPYRFNGDDLSPEREFAQVGAGEARYRVVAYDCGVKRSILEELARAGCDVSVVPWNTPAEDVLAQSPDGVFLSNGPGDPDAVAGTYRQVGGLLGKVPVFGICLGHQMICKAAGARFEKMKYGHHGGNQPVANLVTGRVEITSQNHGFNLSFPSLGALVPELSGGSTKHADDLRFWSDCGIAPIVSNARYGNVRLTHVNLNDGTAEGVEFLDIPAFSVQYHPEARPGPADSHYLFTAFTRLMDGRADYLDVDIAQDRLQGWRF